MGVESRGQRARRPGVHPVDGGGINHLGHREPQRGLSGSQRLYVRRDHDPWIRPACRWHSRSILGSGGHHLSQAPSGERGRRRRLAQLRLLSPLSCNHRGRHAERGRDVRVHAACDRELSVRIRLHVPLDSMEQEGDRDLRADGSRGRSASQPPAVRLHRQERRCVGDPARRGPVAEGSERLSGRQPTGAGGDRPELRLLAGRLRAARAPCRGTRSPEGLRRTPDPDDRAYVLEARRRPPALWLFRRLQTAADGRRPCAGHAARVGDRHVDLPDRYRRRQECLLHP